MKSDPGFIKNTAVGTILGVGKSDIFLGDFTFQSFPVACLQEALEKLDPAVEKLLIFFFQCRDENPIKES